MNSTTNAAAQGICKHCKQPIHQPKNEPWIHTRSGLWTCRNAQAMNSAEPEFAPNAEQKLRKLYDAIRAGLSSTKGRTFEEWCEKVSDYGLDDARQALLQQSTYCYAEGDEGAKYCGDPQSKHCAVLGDATFWESVAGQNHLVECLRDDHFIHHKFVSLPSSQGCAPLTDAEVDAFLEAHKNDPVDEESAWRIEWLFRKKLAADALNAGREWLKSYQDDVVKSGRRVKHDMELLYSGTKTLIENLVRVIDTLAIEPSVSSEPEKTDARFKTAMEVVWEVYGPASYVVNCQKCGAKVELFPKSIEQELKTE